MGAMIFALLSPVDNSPSSSLKSLPKGSPSTIVDSLEPMTVKEVGKMGQREFLYGKNYRSPISLLLSILTAAPETANTTMIIKAMEKSAEK